jgi:hypothetical protein
MVPGFEAQEREYWSTWSWLREVQNTVERVLTQERWGESNLQADWVKVIEFCKANKEDPTYGPMVAAADAVIAATEWENHVRSAAMCSEAVQVAHWEVLVEQWRAAHRRKQHSRPPPCPVSAETLRQYSRIDLTAR